MTSFTVNGRFLSQRITGVQRYAYEITKRLISEVSTDSTLEMDLLAPESIRHAPVMGDRARLRAVGPFRGHVWEQITLPSRSNDLLINLCNSGALAKRRQITCIHGANTFVYPDSYSKSFRWSQKVLLHSIGVLSEQIATVSQASADLLHELKIVPRGKAISIIPNGYEHALLWKPEASRIFEKLRTGRPFILLIGSSSPHKNVKLITSLTDGLDRAGIDIALAGGSFNVFSSDIAHDDASNVVRLGYVTDDDLAYLLSRAMCFVFPSIVEGFGLPLVEAMAWKCPIIASDRASMPEVCGDAAILLSPYEANVWLDAIIDLNSDEEKRKTLVRNGLVQVKRFSWHESARKYLNLIEKMI